ncbi:TraB/GumN family protein [Enterobacteriaceae bacterium H20N1]|uniref:TraB/GumN family protein n=1 Tax=Dryocola boscaweniae TaxID=2925397 RepID=A0A9X2W6G0_9ENTR|nr:TraB/GumN family protein [Dryocola boscaweniae]MCT4701680.1 TraB/GumN family protein [Dryocola boscaweniae]MCT4716323.1 TraB/GumN family protein [Dryocola boscaweniae]MCT4718849.1 TraB/GumN family protein [Dryocola boscaweniae]
MGLLSRINAFFSSLSATTYPWPALDVVLPGKRYLHLVGSIHMGTRDMAPLSQRLLDKLRDADALIVEADISEGGSPFSGSAEDIPLEERLSPDDWERVVSLTQEMGISLDTIDNQPAWQIALVLQAHQAQRLGLRPDYGIDFQLLEAARALSVPVIELEGAQSQIDMLTQLPQGGMPLLQDTLAHWHTNARLLQMMIGWWLESPPRQGNIPLPNTFGDELYDVLMRQRNRQWQTFLQQLPAGRYVVAVGALHLYGEGNLPNLLKNT